MTAQSLNRNMHISPLNTGKKTSYSPCRQRLGTLRKAYRESHAKSHNESTVIYVQSITLAVVQSKEESSADTRIQNDVKIIVPIHVEKHIQTVILSVSNSHVQHHSTLFNIIQHLFNIIQHLFNICSTLLCCLAPSSAEAGPELLF